MKQSVAKAIKSKQSSAYSSMRSTTPAIHQIDGSSRREVSRRQIKPLRSFSGAKTMKPSESVLDAQAERTMSAGWSKKKNPICSTCFSQKSTSGSCNCN